MAARKQSNGKRPDKRMRQFNFRLDDAEYALVAEAAGDYPPATWARVQLLRAARAAIEEQKARAGR